MDLGASLVLLYWPSGPDWSYCIGPSGQFSPDLLALRASLVLTFSHLVSALLASLVTTYWPFGPVSAVVLALRASLVLSYWSLGPFWT